MSIRDIAFKLYHISSGTLVWAETFALFSK